MKISIITINLNNLNGLEATMKSVISQDYFDECEWIIVDGGSTDGSVDLIKSVSSVNMRYISEPDSGIYNAMNKGIRMSKGEYLLFMNSGDKIYSADVLGKTIKRLSSGKDLYIGKAMMGDVVSELDLSDDYKVLRHIQFYLINHQSVFIKRDLFEKYGYYREDHKISSDWWHFYKCLVCGDAKFEMLPYIVADYDLTGISTIDRSLTYGERETLMDEYPRQHLLARFYMDNLEYVNIMRANRFTFLLSRILFAILRRFLPKEKVTV